MKARRLPGVRCSTLKTECRSLLCLMIMPGRSWVAGIAIAESISFIAASGRGKALFRRARGNKLFILHVVDPLWESGTPGCYQRLPILSPETVARQLK